MNLAESGKVSTIIVKDMSRLERNYLMVRQYTEMTFPSLGIRFIAINDGVDTLHGENDMAPFNNLFNDFLAKDTSRKIRAVKKAQAERGECISSKAPYGYRKNPENPKKLVVDGESGRNVQMIFRLCAEGLGPNQIAKKLKEKQILTPSRYYYQKTGALLTNIDPDRPYDWSCRTVSDIWDNEAYLGNTVSLRQTTVSYKNKKRIDRPKDEWVVKENTHKALVSKELWDIAHDVRRSKKRPRKNMETLSLFSGLVFCADCGKPLLLRRSRGMDEGKYSLTCATYRMHGKERCSGHYIRESQLKTIILDDLKRVTHFARKHEQLFAKRISQKTSAETSLEINRLRLEIDQMNRRNTDLGTPFKRVYEDNVLGKLTEVQFKLLSEGYLIEQQEIKNALPEMEKRLETLQNSVADANGFIEKTKKYSKIDELTPELLRLFIKKIVVGERSKKYSRTASQDIWIYYRDVGLVGFPIVKAEWMQAEPNSNGTGEITTATA